MNEAERFNKLEKAAIKLGAYKSAVINADEISTDKSFRDMCKTNACGMYDKCYMCPPLVGDIDTLMASIGKYDYALVYQTVSGLEDSYDFEGMLEAKKRTYALARSLKNEFILLGIADALHLGAGGCGACAVCAKQDNEPCRFPTLAMPSLEAYGINVSSLAQTAKMMYTNGKDTVTYFGAVLFSID